MKIWKDRLFLYIDDVKLRIGRQRQNTGQDSWRPAFPPKNRTLGVCSPIPQALCLAANRALREVNNYDKEVFNGDIGVILNSDLNESLLQIIFDERTVDYDFNELDEIALAYATSIHKAQGSEYPVVVIPLAMQHFMLLERNLLYTGITRGKQLVVVIAQTKALAMAVKNQRSQRRITYLISRLN